MTVRFGPSSSINSSDEMFGCESFLLSGIRSVKDGALRFFHIAREEELSHACVCTIRNRRLRC